MANFADAPQVEIFRPSRLATDNLETNSGIISPHREGLILVGNEAIELWFMQNRFTDIYQRMTAHFPPQYENSMIDGSQLAK